MLLVAAAATLSLWITVAFGSDGSFQGKYVAQSLEECQSAVESARASLSADPDTAGFTVSDCVKIEVPLPETKS